MDNTNKEEQWFNCLKKGVALDKLGKYQEAIEVYDKAIEIHPEIYQPYLIKADNLIKLGKYQEAMDVVDKILLIEPANSDALISKKHIENLWTEAQTRGKVVGSMPVEELKSSIKQTESVGTYLFFDTETTGLPNNWNAPVSDLGNWPRLVQIAWILCDKNGNYLEERSYTIKPDGFTIPADASIIHGITTECAEIKGVPLQAVLVEFQKFVTQADFLIAHNMSFDEKIIGAEFLRKNMPNSFVSKKTICTKEISTNFCAIPSSNGFNDYKWPKLSELYYKLFGKTFNETHDALSDVRATAECFWEMKVRKIL